MPSANLSAVVPAASPDPIFFAASCLLPELSVLGIALDVVPAVCALGQLPGGHLGPCEDIRISVQMSHLGLHSMGIGYYVPHECLPTGSHLTSIFDVLAVRFQLLCLCHPAPTLISVGALVSIV